MKKRQSGYSDVWMNVFSDFGVIKKAPWLAREHADKLSTATLVNHDFHMGKSRKLCM